MTKAVTLLCSVRKTMGVFAGVRFVYRTLVEKHDKIQLGMES